MRHVFTSATHHLLRHARRGALLLALGAAGPAARGQSFGPVSTYPTGAGSEPHGVAIEDVNTDGRPDIVFTNSGTHTVGVLLVQAGGTFAPAATYSTGTSSAPLGVALGDVNADGRPDIVTANSRTHTAGVLLGQAGGTFGPVTAYSTGAFGSPFGVALGDVNRDGRLDIVAANYSTSTVGVLLGQASGTFATVASYPTGASSGPFRLALGDVNADGRPDIITANFTSSSVGVLLGQAGGTFAAVVLYPNGMISHPGSVALGDVNGDGRPDIVTADYFANTVGILAGQAGGTFAAVVSYSTGATSGPYTVTIGDVNGDGQPDIVTANSVSNTVGVLLGQAGPFAPVVTYSTGAGSAPISVALADVNSDGRPDIVTTNIGTNTVGVFLNTGTFTPLATARPLAADFALAPNPAHGTFTVQLPAGLVAGPAELLNSLGQVVCRPAVAGPRFAVETAGLAPGVYTLRLAVGAGTVARRVVVE